MFSDEHKLLKLGICFVILILCGIFYHFNRFKSISDRYSATLTVGSSICIFNAEIHRISSNEYVSVKKGKRFKILELPDSIAGDPQGEFAIKGYLTGRNVLVVEAIRRQFPRFYKLLYSGITALGIGALFFVYFRFRKGYFLPKETM